MLDTLDEAKAPMIGLLPIDDETVHLAREATPTHARRDEGPARGLERVLRSSLAWPAQGRRTPIPNHHHPPLMSDMLEAQLDVLDILEGHVDLLIKGLRGTQTDAAYVEGQIAYLEALDARLGDVPEDVRPRDLLEEIANELGLAFDGVTIKQPPQDAHEAGLLSAWSLCLGFVEGAAMGAQAASNALQGAFEDDENLGVPP